MRVVLDANVLVSALISPAGSPREILTAWTQGRFDLIASPELLDELRDVLARAKFRRWVSAATAADYLISSDRHLTGLADPNPPVLTPRQFVDRLTEASSA